MSNYKMVVLDLDGTTCLPLDNIVESNIEPIKQVIKKGVRVVFATGRPIKAKFNNLEKFEFSELHSIGIGFNGATIYDLLNKKEIAAFPLEKEKATKVFNLLKKPEFKECILCAYTVQDDITYVTKKIEESKDLEFESKLFEKPATIYDDSYEMFDCYKILVFNANEEFKQEVINIGLEIAWSKQSLSGEITRKGVNKKLAVEYLSNMFKVDPINILAMGDGENDVEMLKYAGLSIAPKNACDNAKSNAKVVSEFKDADGVVGIELNNYILKED
ncbi:Cof-type HAD-IIB family hydrolase [Spiroplasma turonicum]|uniref:HAD family hydrolase n=1 Tax=Spiroplasma turonicum TaxID=216946 RepID=A0A0K1P7E8_9MOLU|nr:Cof-type HAD-IIB family hydrolase [Spiroplasma turonicum]AKU80213.1 HAD family hydrolase [Spiroplasma turonicum]ALX71213.1 HAD family hydrolase [Spiroplasma turonicum]